MVGACVVGGGDGWRGESEEGREAIGDVLKFVSSFLPD